MRHRGMDLARLTLFQALDGKLDWLTQRHSITARNIANADTPGFVPQDLQPFDFARTVRDAEARRAGRDPRAPEQRTAYEVSPDGNAVTLEEQMMRVSETSVDYQTMINLYAKQIGLLKTALGTQR